jgi:hypothetical protein
MKIRADPASAEDCSPRRIAAAAFHDPSPALPRPAETNPVP